MYKHYLQIFIATIKISKCQLAFSVFFLCMAKSIAIFRLVFVKFLCPVQSKFSV